LAGLDSTTAEGTGLFDSLLTVIQSYNLLYTGVQRSPKMLLTRTGLPSRNSRNFKKKTHLQTTAFISA